MNLYKIAGCVANSVDPDQTPRSTTSDLGLHYLLMPVCPNTSNIYGNMFIYPTSCVRPWGSRQKDRRVLLKKYKVFDSFVTLNNWDCLYLTQQYIPSVCDNKYDVFSNNNMQLLSGHGVFR